MNGKTMAAVAAAAIAATASGYGPGDAKKGFIRLNAPLAVEAKDAPLAAALGRALVSASRKDAGVVGYDMYESATRPGRFVFCETWKDRAALDAHSASPHFTGIVPELQKLGPMTVDAFTIGEDVPGGKLVRLNCFKTAKPGKDRDELLEKAKRMVAETLALDEGVVEYDIMVSVSDPREMMVYETWKDLESLDRHAKSAHLAAIGPQMKPLAERSWLERFVK